MDNNFEYMIRTLCSNSYRILLWGKNTLYTFKKQNLPVPVEQCGEQTVTALREMPSEILVKMAVTAV